MPIHLLSEAVASQIAAGEVVERPASVVKELLENSLDAGATRISIQIQQAGKQLIEVTDNGTGIPFSEVELAVTRHATSKLNTAADLFAIRTLGFRGEALASIASVSRSTLTTRTENEEAGSRLVVEGGEGGKLEKMGFPTGTSLRVENLFANVPARLKFLKTDATERQQVHALVTRYALAYSQVQFSLVDDGRVVLQTSGSGNRREVLANLYGVEIARQMLQVIFEDGDISIEGFTSPLSLTRSNRKEMTFFVNGRWIQDTALNAAMVQAYAGLLMVGRFPISVLFIKVPPEDVDVNVHPAKAEVRFRSSDKIFAAVQRAVRRAVMAYSPIPEIPSQRLWSAPVVSNTPAAPSRTPGLDWQMAAEVENSSDQTETATSVDETNIPAGNFPGGLPLLRLIGQIGATYLVAEGPDGLYLIDQHAAHERVLFEKLMNQRGREVVMQPLLQPVTIQLAPHQAAILTDSLETLARLGFVVDEFGTNTFRIRAIPALFLKNDPQAILRAVVEEIEEDESPMQSEVEAIIASRVCKSAAVKGGTLLAPEEQSTLLRDLEKCQSPRTCPHGRPTMIHLSVDLLERQFGRRGSR
ncbi:MAG: DNA mismatch repair endonuclease MutL [Anaerolineaceae bacterium]